MRHLKKGRKLNRTSSHRKALFSNLASSLVINKRIITTHPKAKELQRFIERLVTYAKYEGERALHGRRLIQKRILGTRSKSIANELIHNIAPQYLSRNGGYTRVIKLENRKNDDALKALIEFVDLKDLSDNSTSEDNKKSQPTIINQK